MRFDEATIKQRDAIIRMMWRVWGTMTDQERIQRMTSLLTDIGYSPEDPKDTQDLTRGEASALISKLHDLINLENERHEPNMSRAQ